VRDFHGALLHAVDHAEAGISSPAAWVLISNLPPDIAFTRAAKTSAPP
jgi:hypothetical protein